MRNKIFITLAVIFQILIIAVMIVKAMMPLYTGKEVLLRTRPVDPRSIFSGDYVDLNYDFSSFYADSISNDLPEKLNPGDEVFVTFDIKEGNSKLGGVWANQPTGKQFMKAIVDHDYGGGGGHRRIGLTAGIETYFTDSRTAQKLEAEQRAQRGGASGLLIAVMVAPDGCARIKEIRY